MIRFKIVLVPFPFDDFSSTKVRPALCLTDEIGIHKHVIIAFISTKPPAPLESSDYFIDSNSSTFKMTGL